METVCQAARFVQDIEDIERVQEYTQPPPNTANYSCYSIESIASLDLLQTVVTQTLLQPCRKKNTMSFLKVVIPLFIVLGILQAAVLTLPFLYLRFEWWLNPIEKFLFIALL